MKLHAGSLYKDYLVLYGEGETPRCIRVNDNDLQWEIYCNDVEVSASDRVEGFLDVDFNGKQYSFPYWQTDNPMKSLGWLE